MRCAELRQTEFREPADFDIFQVWVTFAWVILSGVMTPVGIGALKEIPETKKEKVEAKEIGGPAALIRRFIKT